MTLTITSSNGSTTVTGDTLLIRLILSSAMADMNATAMNKGSADYRTLYGRLSETLGAAVPWPLTGKFADMSVLLAAVRGEVVPTEPQPVNPAPAAKPAFSLDDLL